jgi:hypothetical protein
MKEGEMDTASSTHGRENDCIQGSDSKARRKETTRKTRHRWEDNIKMDLRKIRWSGTEWIN